MTHLLHNMFFRRISLFCMALLITSGTMYSPTATGASSSSGPHVRLDVPFVPTPPDVVDKMLDLADVQSSDFLIDLGAGDGRIAIAAVRDRGAQGAYGVDLNPVRVEEARANARDAGVDDRVTFDVEDLFETDFSSATVVSMYLLPDVNIKLRPKILAMAPGTRIVSHAFDMGDWYADNHVRVNNLDVYLWIVPTQVAGQWDISTPAGAFSIDVTQEFQLLTGTARLPDQKTATVEGRLRGNIMQFDVDDGSTIQRYVGRVQGDIIVPMPEPGAQPDWRGQKM